MLRLRKSVNSLIAAEKANLVAAIKALKANGKYDQYVKEHRDAMNQATLMPGENPPPPQSNYRNVAHRGPAFGPWHREMLQRFELDLQAEVPGVTLPYWDWAADSQLADPKTAPIWGADLMGGDGDPNNTNLVGTGPFRYDPNDPNTWARSHRSRRSWPGAEAHPRTRSTATAVAVRHRLGVADYSVRFTSLADCE